MKWTSTVCAPGEEKLTLSAALERCTDKVKEDLGGASPDLLIGFVSPDFRDGFESLPRLVSRQLKPAVFIGCSAGGIVGGGQEVEREPAVALTAAILPGVDIKAFHIDNDAIPDLDAPPSAWESMVGVSGADDPSFILLPDPFSVRIDSLVQGLDYAFPRATKLGGLASGANGPGINALFMNGEMYRVGCVGVALSGNLVVDTVVAQGCRPIGRPLRVTRCDRNFLFELDGEPVINVLHQVLTELPKHDQDLAKHSLFLGVVMNEFQDDFQPGDFLVRNILGLEPVSGALVVGEILRNERTVQFHLRDAATSAEDLRMLLKLHADKGAGPAAGALMFSCLGRGQYLYDRSNHDSDCFREYFGEIPLGGFFCNGEIGPVSGTTFLHGYTSSFGIFRARDGQVS